MQIIDISVPITTDMPVWPGDPAVAIEWCAEIGPVSDVNITKISFGVHTGTHIDAPLHFLPGGGSLDTLDLGDMIGPVQVFEIPDDIGIISADVFMDLPEIICPRLLFKTRNSRLWGQKPSVFNPEYVGLDESAAIFLVDHDVHLVGIDYLSIAPFDAPEPTHKVLLSHDIVILECLDLSKVQAGFYNLICLPINLPEREGAPVRAVLVKENL
ncbi:MAG: cyclase family protein [Anaerolineaceae bacterium]